MASKLIVKTLELFLSKFLCFGNTDKQTDRANCKKKNKKTSYSYIEFIPKIDNVHICIYRIYIMFTY